MKNINILLIIAAVFGLSSVLMGTITEHGLKQSLDEHMFNNVQVALRYHQNYAIILLVLALTPFLELKEQVQKNLNICFYIFISAITIFCGSIYAYSITGSKAISMIAPAGGISMMLAWIFLVYAACDQGD